MAGARREGRKGDRDRRRRCRCRTKTRDIPKQIRQTRRNQGRRGARRQENKGNLTAWPTAWPNTSPTTMAQGTSKLAEKQKKANKKSQNMKKGQRVIPPKKTVAIKQRQATKVRPRGDVAHRYSHTTAGPLSKDYAINRAASSSSGLQWKTYDYETRRFELKGLASTRRPLTTVICIQNNGPPLRRLLLHTEASITREHTKPPLYRWRLNFISSSSLMNPHRPHPRPASPR